METYYSNVARRWMLTLLDFCFKEKGKIFNYPTLLFYQMGYSLFTIWQASRRAYRLNQTKECRTYYLATEGTIQTKVIELIAEKQAATSAIQGKFSTEGLSAMANGTDARMKLAQSLSQKDCVSGNKLQEMFDVLADAEETNNNYDKYKPMLIFKELVGNVETDVAETFDMMKTREIQELSMAELFDFDIISGIIAKELPEEAEQDVTLVMEEYIVQQKPTKRRIQKVTETRQISLFDMI